LIEEFNALSIRSSLGGTTYSFANPDRILKQLVGRTVATASVHYHLSGLDKNGNANHSKHLIVAKH
jgi:hypothetical protein